MDNRSIKKSFFSHKLALLFAYLFAYGLITAAAIFFIPDLNKLHFFLILSACFVTGLATLIFATHFFQKKYITPIEQINNTLKQGNLLSNNHNNINEFINIVDTLHINQKEIKHHKNITSNRSQKDSLTGLENRVSFNEKFEQTVNLNNQYKDSFALIVININKFKNINYTHNQKIGDLILKTTAKSLLDHITRTEIIARTGNDEFAIIIADATMKKVDTICLKLARHINKTYKVQDHRISVKARIGACVYEPGKYNSDDYFNQAIDAGKLALSQQLPYECFKQDKNAYSSRRIEISQAIAKFTKENKLGLYIRYQPKMDLSTGQLSSLEALSRINHPELGRIRPDEFILIAEEDNLISGITDYILEECIKQASTWNNMGKPIPIAVNVSPKDLLDIDFPTRLQLLLKHYKLPGSLIELEVTENVVIEDSRVTNIVLNRIKKLGVSLAIDDFGVGYSGFNNLRSLPFSTLKIDKSFVVGMLDNEEDEIIVTTTIQVAHKLGMKVVAEGIDNIEVAFALTERYCDIGQGYLYSRPVSAEIIENEYLRSNKFA